MSDASETALQTPITDSMAAFSKQLQELTDSLNLLYIRNNASGRNKFRDKWPDVADFIFGEQLITYDNEGVQDREHRSELEVEAGEKRFQLKQTILEFVEKSVDQGSLLFDYVGGIIDIYGAGVSKCLYAEDVIERVRPGILAILDAAKEAEAKKQAAKNGEEVDVTPNSEIMGDDVAKTEDVQETPSEDQKLSVEEQSILSNTPKAVAESSGGDALDDVKPIETDAPLSSQRTLNNPVPDAPQMVEEKPTEAAQSKEDIPTVPLVEAADKLEDKPQDQLQEKPKEKAETLPTRPMSEVLDSIKPIDTSGAADVAVEEKKPIEEPVVEPVIEAPVEAESSETENLVTKAASEEVPVPDVVTEEPAPAPSPTGKAAKGTYVSLFNGVAGAAVV
ncbi:MAG: hypothetical protein COB14_03010 [Alphaproteobacteria bacterium]|nr:MAG: hypothetical protein COB14_03010 [Alphaproteobacteria bacterium]